MSLLQEPVAIILYLELELSRLMRLHDILMIKRGEHFSDLEGRFPSCVLSFFGPEKPTQAAEWMCEVEPKGWR